MLAYVLPTDWIRYEKNDILTELVEARAALLSLRTVPYQKRWIERLQQLELKREIAGTTRIEGADFTDRELDDALTEKKEDLRTRSQRQARAAVRTYRWIATLPDDRPVSPELIREIHAHIVRDADEDHCEPGRLRSRDMNVMFGLPGCRGAEGGPDCEEAFERFALALRTNYLDHEPMIRAMAAHYHLAAMHPFLDGNGRTARALEALMLQRAGLRDTCHVAMSNYYHDEKDTYLAVLHDVRERGHDLTPFLKFALRGVAQQSARVLGEIQVHIQRELYVSLANELFARLAKSKRRVVGKRQLAIVTVLAEVDSIVLESLMERVESQYTDLSAWRRAFIRDLTALMDLGAVSAQAEGDRADRVFIISAKLDWPTRMTESQAFKKLKELPKASSTSFLR